MSEQATSNKNKQAKRGRTEADDDDYPSNSMESEIKDMLRSLSTKMDTLQVSMTDIDSRLNTKIDSLEGIMSGRINEVKNEFENRIVSVCNDFNQRLVNTEKDAKEKCERNASNAARKVWEHVDEIRARHESRLERLERYSLEKDIIISGIPIDNKDDPFAILGDICKALNCTLKQGDFSSVFRLGNNANKTNHSRSVPIVARVQDEWVKQQIMGAYFKKKDLNLKDIGFRTSSRIFINERLTSTNREIFNRASEAKKSNFIHRFYTRRGLVYVQRRDNERPMCMFNIEDINMVFPSEYYRPRQLRTNDVMDKQRIPIPHQMPSNPLPLNATDIEQSSTSQLDHANTQSH